MNNLSFVAAAALLLLIAPSARAADLPLKAAMPFAERFTWTGCYLGTHVGGAWMRNTVTDPVGSFNLVSTLMFSPPLTAAGAIAAPWRDLADCPLDP